MKNIYGIIFGYCNPSLQSVLKVVPEYENKSKYCDCLWLIEELKNHGGSRPKSKHKDVPNITSHLVPHYASRPN